jgi:hypothetical protein
MCGAENSDVIHVHKSLGLVSYNLENTVCLTIGKNTVCSFFGVGTRIATCPEGSGHLAKLHALSPLFPQLFGHFSLAVLHLHVIRLILHATQSTATVILFLIFFPNNRAREDVSN